MKSPIQKKIEQIGERFERHNFDPMLHSRGRTYIDINQAKSFLNTALLELLEVIKESLPEEKNIDPNRTTDERRYPHGYNACLSDIKEVLEVKEKKS